MEFLNVAIYSDDVTLSDKYPFHLPGSTSEHALLDKDFIPTKKGHSRGRKMLPETKITVSGTDRLREQVPWSKLGVDENHSRGAFWACAFLSNSSSGTGRCLLFMLCLSASTTIRDLSI